MDETGEDRLLDCHRSEGVELFSLSFGRCQYLFLLYARKYHRLGTPPYGLCDLLLLSAPLYRPMPTSTGRPDAKISSIFSASTKS